MWTWQDGRKWHFGLDWVFYKYCKFKVIVGLHNISYCEGLKSKYSLITFLWKKHGVKKQ